MERWPRGRSVEGVFRPTLPLETPRLVLRPFTIEDYDDAFGYHCRADVVRYLYWEPPTPEEFREVLARRAGRTTLDREGDGLNLAVVPRDVDRVIGDVTLFWCSEQHRQGEIGFVFHPAFQDRGYAFEASQAMLRLGFQDLCLHRIAGRLDSRNTSSAHLLERLGMRREAHLVENEHVKGEWVDEVVYGLLDRDWAAAQSPEYLHRRGTMPP